MNNEPEKPEKKKKKPKSHNGRREENGFVIYEMHGVEYARARITPRYDVKLVGFLDIDHVEEEVLKLDDSKSTKVGSYTKERDAWESTTKVHQPLGILKQGDFYYAKKENKLVYVLWTQTQRLAMIDRDVTRIAVWRSILGPSGMNDHLFWEVLMKQPQPVLTDVDLYSTGERYWLGLCYRAFEHGYHVYMLNLMTQEIMKFTEPQQINAMWRTYYKREYPYREFRYLITAEPDLQTHWKSDLFRIIPRVMTIEQLFGITPNTKRTS